MKNNVFVLLASICLVGSINLPAFADDWHHDADIDHDGHLNYHEWQDWNRHHPGVAKREWRSRFNTLDHDHDGYLDHEEVRELRY